MKCAAAGGRMETSMKKIIIALIASALLVFSAFSAFAWAPEDIITDGETEIILPLQKPDIKIGGAFQPDNEAEDHNGNKGNVYTGKVSVNKQGEQTVMATLSNYRFNEGTYRLSVWFKEDNSNPKSEENPDGAVNMTRMLRPHIGGKDTIRQGSSYLFFTDKSMGIKRGEWTHAVLDFTVSTANSSNTYCIGTPVIELKWEASSAWDSEPFADRNKNADYYVSFSDIVLFKYPSQGLALEATNSGAELEASGGAFRSEFSAPIDTETVRHITVNGAERNADTLDIHNEENCLVISPKGGFPPGKAYDISFDGFSDIFGRAYEESVTGSVKTKEYLAADYKGKTDNNAVFEVTNNMTENASFVIALFCYENNTLKGVFYSQNITDAEPGVKTEVSVPVSEGMSGYSAKAQIWNLSSFVPMPMSAEIEL